MDPSLPRLYTSSANSLSCCTKRADGLRNNGICADDLIGLLSANRGIINEKKELCLIHSNTNSNNIFNKSASIEMTSKLIETKDRK